jgi:hypothetical protein
MEETDSGVKFAAWGRTCDRFYTGSSDGVVKAWNIRAPPGQAFIRDVISLSGGVSTGKFSPDFSNLILGDSTGKVHLLSFGGFAQEEVTTSLRRPITPHHPLSPPLIDEDDQEIDPPQTAQERARQFLDRRQITICEDEYIGAVQGPNYASTGLYYNPDKFRDENGEHSIGWSMSELIQKQQIRFHPGCIKLTRIPEMDSSSRLVHERNLALDLDTAMLPAEIIRELKSAGVDLGFEDVHEFDFELEVRMDEKTSGDDIPKNNRLLSTLHLKADIIKTLLILIIDPDEIKEFLELKVKISKELEIQKALKTLLL